MRAPGTTPATVTALLLALIVAVTGCSSTTGTARPTDDILVRAVDPSFVYGTDGSPHDILAATVVTDVQDYWSRAFPRHFDSPWRPIDGGFFSVDTTTEGATPPPCTAEVADLAGNAFYCASVDAVAWDRAALLPVLAEHYGRAAVVTVLAHEMGHAVHQRRAPASGDTGSPGPVATETIADCYAGAYTRWVVDGHSTRLHIRKAQLNGAMRALTSSRDPVGMSQSDTDAHGTALDRVAAFQDGYRGGPEVCTSTAPDDRRPTGTDLAPVRPNQPLEEVLRSGTAAIRDYFAELVDRGGGRWVDPVVRRSLPRGCTTEHRVPVSYCPHPPAVVVDHRELAGMHHDIGDQATVTALTSRYALAALSALGRPTSGAEAGRRASCLTGAYTGSLLHDTGERPPLSAGDLDEAVILLLSRKQVGRDASGASALTGFDRLAAFRAGMHGGPEACEA